MFLVSKVSSDCRGFFVQIFFIRCAGNFNEPNRAAIMFRRAFHDCDCLVFVAHRIKRYPYKETSAIRMSLRKPNTTKNPSPMYKHEKTSPIPVLPLLFIRFSRNRPLRVRNSIRYNRRNLSQPCHTYGSVRCSEAIFHISNLVPLSQRCLSAPGTFSVKSQKYVLSSSLRFTHSFDRVAHL